MLRKAAQTEKLLLELLETWGEALVSLQTDMPSRPVLDGGVLCPACKMIHGRCHEAVYPLLALAKYTGRREFIRAAEKLFRWGGNMLLPDGSMRNDAKSGWRGTTVFGAVALHDALYYHGDLLPEAEKNEWEERLRLMGAWLYENLRPGKTQAYINYYASNACAMALLGNYFRKEEYTALARELAGFCFSHTGESGLIYGEGHPTDILTAKGCRAVDTGGYNVEETLPMLTRCAQTLGDGEMLKLCESLWRAHLIFMLPDGAWDDSAGSRAFKWSYWGGRTSDGCQAALFYLGRKDSVFAEAALRNAELYARCTRGGLLDGGRDYGEVGELPCSHHAFCHAKVIAGSLDSGLYDFERVPLPCESARGVIRFPELDVLRVSYGGWIADVSGYDHSLFPGDHASGGTLSLLWHKKTGPLIACGAADHRIREQFNQQLPSDASLLRCACPRVELSADGVRYTQYYCLDAKISCTEDACGATAVSEGCLRDEKGVSLPGGDFTVRYEFGDDVLRVRGGVAPEIAGNTLFILPLIGPGARVEAVRGALHGAPERFFVPSPGFAGAEFKIRPEADGSFEAVISV